MTYPFRATEIVGPLQGKILCGSENASFTTFCIDSRLARANTLFVPLIGQHRDGHCFITDAFMKGAQVALLRQNHSLAPQIISAVQEPEKSNLPKSLRNSTLIEVRHTLVALQKLATWFRKKFSQVKLFAITGSVGKTQTKEMALSILKESLSVVGTDKNFNNEIGVPLAVGKLAPGVEAAVIEMAMRGRGEISLLSRIAEPDFALITNTHASHIGRLGSRVEIAKAKAEIVDGLKAGGVLWLNRNDQGLPTVLKEVLEKPAFREGIKLKFFDVSRAKEAAPTLPPIYADAQGINDETLANFNTAPELWVEEVELLGLSGSRFVVSTPQQKERVRLRVLGRGAVENFACACAVCLELGLTLKECAERAEALLPVPQRLVPFELKPGVILIDDTYNSAPASCEEAVELLSLIPPDFKKIVVVGDMLELGRYEKILHRQVAQQVYAVSPRVLIAVGPRARAFKEVPIPEGVEVIHYEGTASAEETADETAVKEQGGIYHALDNSTHGMLIADDETIEEVKKDILRLVETLRGKIVVLVKGSRALHLERLVNGLVEHFGGRKMHNNE